MKKETEKRRLKRDIVKLLKIKKIKEAGLLIQRYRSKYGESSLG